MKNLKDYYADYCRRFSEVYFYIKDLSSSPEKAISDVCKLRSYVMEDWYSLLDEAGVFLIPEDIDVSLLKHSSFSDLGLFDKHGNFLLRGRYIIKVCDMVGNVIALVGWYPDDKRYITTPSYFFVRKGLMFGLDQLRKGFLKEPVFLTEGIFDSLAVRTLGFKAFGMMGSGGSNEKEALYGLLGKIIAIPDKDAVGAKVVKEDKWRLPKNGVYLTWNASFKDIDDIIKVYDEEDLREELRRIGKNVKSERIVEMCV